MSKHTIKEELDRYNEIISYAKNLLFEQEAEPVDFPPVEGVDEPEGGQLPPEGGDLPPAPGGDLPPAPGGDLPPAPEGDLPPAPEGDVPSEGDSTEDIDVTELVNLIKNVKKDLEANKTDNSGAVSKMDDIFSKLSDLEGKLGEMDSIISKIDELGTKVEQMKPPTPQERLEMRSLDSYPFNEKPNEFFSRKQEEMKQSGKNEYVLRKSDIDTYGRDEIRKSFNPEKNPDQL